MDGRSNRRRRRLPVLGPHLASVARHRLLRDRPLAQVLRLGLGGILTKPLAARPARAQRAPSVGRSNRQRGPRREPVLHLASVVRLRPPRAQRLASVRPQVSAVPLMRRQHRARGLVQPAALGEKRQRLRPLPRGWGPPLRSDGRPMRRTVRLLASVRVWPSEPKPLQAMGLRPAPERRPLPIRRSRRQLARRAVAEHLPVLAVVRARRLHRQRGLAQLPV